MGATVRNDLFVGVTTWNSELFLDACLRSIRVTTDGLAVRLATVDNESTDRSVAIAREFGAEVQIEHCSQSIALNRLLDMSDARYTLLIHSDVVLVGSDWFSTCARVLKGKCALVSPEDIGCGPLTRPYGRDMPESCFLFFDTEKARRARTWAWVRRRGVPWPHRRLDLEHHYVTHRLPGVLAAAGYEWQPMRVHASPRDPGPPYRPPLTPEYWSVELGTLRYAMGNFYSLDGHLTHYHNWFDRVPKDVPLDSRETTEGAGRGLPLGFLSLGTRRFLEDLKVGALRLPDPLEAPRKPCVTPRHEPDLERPFNAQV